MIQHKPIHAAPLRLQCILLWIQKYDYIIQYKLGEEMVLADRLSRFPYHEENLLITLQQQIDYIHFSN